jgi:hypothetical protein
MKKIIPIISAVIVVLSIVFFLYGSIKLAKAVEPTQILDSTKTSELTKIINPNVDNITVEDTSRLIIQQKAEVIIGVSVVTLVLGGVGFTLSSRKGVS